MSHIVRAVGATSGLIVTDPDGHRFILGRGDDEALRDAADYYGLDRDEITTNPAWLQGR